jgi:archaemetzincin
MRHLLEEAVHELGHIFRLSHCEKRGCVMHFSNSLNDTDFKNYYFYERRITLLSKMYQ